MFPEGQREFILKISELSVLCFSPQKKRSSVIKYGQTGMIETPEVREQKKQNLPQIGLVQ